MGDLESAGALSLSRRRRGMARRVHGGDRVVASRLSVAGADARRRRVETAGQGEPRRSARDRVVLYVRISGSYDCVTRDPAGRPAGASRRDRAGGDARFFVQGAMQCADVPVAFFRVASLAAMAMAERYGRRGFAISAGMCAALDGWVKNEGLLWFAALLIAITVVMRRRLIGLFWRVRCRRWRRLRCSRRA